MFYSRLPLVLYAALTLSTPTIQASQQTPATNWPLQGKTTATWMWMDIYTAELYGPDLQGDFLHNQQPLALQLCYLKDIDADILIEGARAHLPEKLSQPLQAEVDRLHRAYVDVTAGDCYRLQYQGGKTQLLLNGQEVFVSNQQDFKPHYFGIWLGDNPLSAEVKAELLSRLSARE